MRNKYNVNNLNGIEIFYSHEAGASLSDENGGGYLTEVWNKEINDWEEIPGIKRSIADVFREVKRLHGWRKAARLKEAAWISNGCRWYEKMF